MKTKRNLFIASILTLLLVSGISSCTKTPATAQNNNEFNVTASFYPQYIMLLNITQDVPDVKVSLLAPANTGCLHDYQMTTRDMKLIQDTDLLIINGADMEHFMESSLQTKSPEKIISVTDNYPLLEGNPHIWVSPLGAIYQTEQTNTKGKTKIGNIFEDEFKDILESDLYKKVIDGFNNRKPLFQLCKKCTFRNRFK